MKRGIEWIEKLEDGVKRTVRIAFEGQGKLKWQFKRSDEELWDYKTPPSADDWDMLQEKIDGLYNRRRAAFKDVELVRQLRQEAARS